MNDATTIDALREQVEARRLQAEMAELERNLRTLDTQARLLEGGEWGDIVDRREFLYDTAGWNTGGRDMRISRPDDRARGIFRPFFENELDLANIRGIGRFLGTSTAIGVGVMENLKNYTIGSGFVYEAQPIGKASKNLVDAAQAFVDAFTEQLAEREAFERVRTDGDWFMWIHEFQGEPVGDVIEPEFVTEPRDVRSVEEYLDEYGLDWSFGVASLPNRPARVVAYFVSWYGSSSDWDVIPAWQMLHNKVNVPTGVKRGIGDFYAVYLELERALKLLGNTSQGAAIQAAIAYIREHATGVGKADVVSFANAKADQIQSTPLAGGGTRQVRQQKHTPGKILDVLGGTKYHAGPLGTNNAPVYIGVIQAGFRVVGARWAMPEYMISGDASNNNYAAILTAGGPFDRATQARQDPQVRIFEKAHWMALDIHCRRGRFSKWGINTLTELQQMVSLHITPPTVAVSDPAKLEEIRDKQQAAGILSARTRAAQSDLDYDAEVTNGAKPSGMIAPGQPFPDFQPAHPRPPAEPAKTEQPPQPPKPAGNPVADPETSLNGAQITAAIAVLSDLSAGRSTVEIALGLLMAVGLDEAMARRMVTSASTLTPPAKEPDPKQAAVTAALESVRTTEEARAILSESYP